MAKEEVRVPEPRYMKPLRYQTDKDSSSYMRMRQEQNREASVSNPAENWMAAKLARTGRKWTRQVTWGFRVFDFWCAVLGIAVEVDGKQHDQKYDAYRDEYNYRRSGIVVLRVRAFDEGDSERALEAIAGALTWKERRAALGLDARSRKARRRLVSAQQELP